MSPGHFIPNLHLALLCDIYLGKLDDTRRKLIPNGDAVLFPLVNGINFLELNDVVVDQSLVDLGLNSLVRGQHPYYCEG